MAQCVAVSITLDSMISPNVNRYRHVVFVDASSLLNIQSDLKMWSQSHGDGHKQDSWKDGYAFLSRLPSNQPSVLILDNANDPKLNLISFIPQNINLTIILTSRNRDLGHLSTTHHLELGPMDADVLRAAPAQLSQNLEPPGSVPESPPDNESHVYAPPPYSPALTP